MRSTRPRPVGATPRTSTTATLLVAVVALLLSGCGGNNAAGTTNPETSPVATSKPGSADAGTPKPAEQSKGDTWADYLWSKPGNGCTLKTKPIVVTVSGTTLRTTSVTRQRLTSKTGPGDSFGYVVHALNTITTTNSNPSPGESGNDATVETFDLRYSLNTDDALNVLPQAVTVSGLNMRVAKGAQIYPTLVQTKNGEAVTRESEFGLEASPGISDADLRELTNDGSATLRYKLTYQVSGVPTALVETPFGTFDDVVAVRYEPVSFQGLNMKPSATDGADADSLLDAFGKRATVVFARGTGIVQVRTQSKLGSEVASATSCTGAIGYTAPTVKAKRGDGATTGKARTITVPAADHGAAFVSPSGNIGCLISSEDDAVSAPAQVRCDIAEYAYKPPPTPSDCPLDYGGSLTLESSASLLCYGDTLAGLADLAGSGPFDYTKWFDPNTDPTVPRDNGDAGTAKQAGLGYGNSITYRQITCTSAQSGIACANTKTGATFHLARGAYSLR